MLKAVLPEDPSDDVALLLARTRALGADRIATWDVLPDPAHVAAHRQAATDQLTAWGLDEASFVTELVVSELVTNAIRYGDPPIQLRLIRDRTLICEVSDGSCHLPASAPGPRLRRGRPRTAAGRPAHPALGQPADRQRQDDLGGTASCRPRDHSNGQPGLGTSSENGAPCGST